MEGNKTEIGDCAPMPMAGEFSNWAGVNNSDLQTIIDFGFIQPSAEGKAKTAFIARRIIMPPKVALELGKILINSFEQNEKENKKN
jgi:hypothetical protein